MPTAKSEIDVYFAGAERWPAELAELRRILLDINLAEDWKWRQPCYTFQKKNIAIIGELNEGAAIGFFKGALLDDPDHVLQPSGPNTRSARDIRFSDVEQIRTMEPTLRALVAAAIEVERSGQQFDFSERDDVPMPDELRDRLERDPGLKAAFEALTPGRKRAYCLLIGQAKQSSTRAGRVEKYAPKILDGLGPQEWG
jgi:uncharacterized protein YdeI (YjbR/CyaY-like superfamily)